MNQIKGSDGEHMKFLTYGTSLHKLGQPRALAPCDFFYVRFLFRENFQFNLIESGN